MECWLNKNPLITTGHQKALATKILHILRIHMWMCGNSNYQLQYDCHSNHAITNINDRSQLLRLPFYKDQSRNNANCIHFKLKCMQKQKGGKYFLNPLLSNWKHCTEKLLFNYCCLPTNISIIGDCFIRQRKQLIKYDRFSNLRHAFMQLIHLHAWNICNNSRLSNV